MSLNCLGATWSDVLGIDVELEALVEFAYGFRRTWQSR